MEQQIEINPEAQKHYDDGIDYFLSGHVEDNLEKAIESFTKAAKQGFRAADLWLYSLNPNEDEGQREKAQQAYAWLLTQDRSQAWVQSDMGFCYQTGLGVEQDLLKTVEYYEEAARADHLPALINLQFYYSQGDAKDLEKAFEYAKRAANLGHAESQYYVGHCFETGQIIDLEKEKAKLQPLDEVAVQVSEQRTITQDLDEAHRYYQLADAQHHGDAQYRLGLLYEYGRGVRADQTRANRYFHHGAQNGSSQAKVRAAAVTADRAYERNFQQVLGYLTLPLNFNRTAEDYALQLEKQAEVHEQVVSNQEGIFAEEKFEDLLASYRVDGAEEEKKAKAIEAAREVAKDLRTQAADLRKKAHESCFGVLKAAKECQLHTFKFRFYQNENYRLQPRKLETLEENLIAALCHSQGFSGCEKNNNSAIGYYKNALQLARSTGFSSAALNALKFLVEKATDAQGEVITLDNPYQTIANTLLYELANYYMTIRKTDRTVLNLEQRAALDKKQAALEVLITNVSQSLATFLEQPTPRNEQAFLDTIDMKNIDECLWDDMTFLPILGNVVIGLTGIGLIAMGINYAVNDRFLFFREAIGGTTEKMEKSAKELGSDQRREGNDLNKL